jgi:predicted dehydrogenase
MNEPAPLALLLCGAGRVVERLYGPALRWSRDTTLVGVVEPRADRGAWATRMLGVPAFPTLAAALAATHPAAVVVATPPDHLVEAAVACLNTRLAVLIEKPGGRSTAEVEQLLGRPGGPLVRLALSRRYWRRYSDQRLTAGRGAGWQVAMTTNRAAWGAIEPPPAESLTTLVEDLLPHAYDLATAVLGQTVAEVTNLRRQGAAVQIDFGGNGRVSLAYGRRWRETVALGAVPAGRRFAQVMRSGRQAVLARLGLRPLEPVEAVAHLLDDFAADVRLDRRNDDLREVAALFDRVRPFLAAADRDSAAGLSYTAR